MRVSFRCHSVYRKIVGISATSIVAFFIFPVCSFAATFFTSEILFENTVWNKEGSPYVIEKKLDVPAGFVLTLESGTILKFAPGAQLNIFGQIQVQGLEDEKVYITSLDDDSVGGDTDDNGDSVADIKTFTSGSINLYRSQSVSFSHAVIKRLEEIYFDQTIADFKHIEMSESVQGFFMWKSNVSVANSFFSNFLRETFLVLNAGYFTLESSQVENNKGQSGEVIGVYGGSRAFVKNTVIKNTGNLFAFGVSGAEMEIEDSVVEGGFKWAGFVSSNSRPARLNILDTTIQNFTDGGLLIFYKSTVSVVDSSIQNTGFGLNVFNSSGDRTPIVIVSNSVLKDNIEYGIYYDSKIGASIIPIEARSNWWGDVSGPFHTSLNQQGLGNEVSNHVVFEPWLTQHPFPEDPPLSTCCSSVAFIPGFQASRLYKQGVFFENKLWEPNRNADVEKLYLNEQGIPLDSAIYTRDIIDEGLSVGPNIYESFIGFMDGLVSDETIAEWKYMPYDWRLKITDIVQNPVHLQDGESYKIVDEILALAERSDTGKVTLIGHSNGGLVSKEIVRELERRGKADIVDKLILVAVPQLGTPKAIIGLLHGDDQVFGLGFILSKTTARLFGEYMFGAYSFLPSRKYFEKVTDPVIVFDPSVSNVNSGLLNYGISITSFENLKSFMTAEEEDRTKPLSFDTFTPNVLKTQFIDSGDSIHNELDTWTPPPHIEVVEIAGWGLDTVKGVEYRAKKTCANASGDFCLNESYVLDRRPLFTSDGDGTVVTPSAINFLGKKYYLNFIPFNTLSVVDRDHASFLEVNSVRLLLENFIKEEGEIPDFVSEEQPPGDDIAKRIRLSVHSPVSLGIHDSLGNYTGIVSDPETDLVHVEESVPNSYYMEFGEGKYTGFILDEYTKIVSLQGTGYGTFTVEIQKVEEENVIEELMFKDLLVTPLLSAELVGVETDGPVLNLDVDGDGNTDFSISSNNQFDPVLYLEMVKKIIYTLDLEKNVEKQLLQKADRAIQLIEKGEIAKVEDKIKIYIKHIDYKKIKKVAEEDKQVLIDMFTNLLNNLN